MGCIDAMYIISLMKGSITDFLIKIKMCAVKNKLNYSNNFCVPFGIIFIIFIFPITCNLVIGELCYNSKI